MCVAVPMLITGIDSSRKHATASYKGNEISVNISIVSPNVGDYALVHAGCAIQIMKKNEAEEVLELFGELEDASK